MSEETTVSAHTNVPDTAVWDGAAPLASDFADEVGEAGPRITPVRAVGAQSKGATALGALAIGAIAIGAVAIGAMAIGRLKIGRARIRRLEIDELIVRKHNGPGRARQDDH